MKRAAIYARFSSDLQQDRSIEDQFALCRSFAAREGFSVVAEYSDRARSGASVFGRDGLLAMVDAARAGQFDTMIVEALDRLSRDQEDLSGLYKRMQFAGVDIIAVHDGKADQVQVGIRGLIGALYLQDLAHKVRRGLHGVVREGRSAGGKAYGYRARAGAPGRLDIVEAEAEIVRRIFAQFIAGKSARAIVAALNAEGVPPPRGKFWRPTTIIGHKRRGGGIVFNDIYSGRITWNRVRMVRDPDTGRRVSRLNPESEWQRADAPELRIVDDATAAAARAQKIVKAPRGRPPRVSHLLSGLLFCAACGGTMAIKDRYNGRRRVQCSHNRDSGVCSHGSAYYLDVVEKRIIGGLREKLGSRDAIAYFVSRFNTERQAAAAAATSSRDRLQRRIADARAALTRMQDAYMAGTFGLDELAARTPALRAALASAEAELAVADEPPPVIVLHPQAAAQYIADLERLAVLVDADLSAGRSDFAEALRRTIARVEIAPGGGISLSGRLESLCSPPFAGRSGLGKSVVAGERSPILPQEAMPFRIAI